MDSERFIADLLSFGYKEFPVAQHERQDANWRFKVKDKFGIKLFVQVRFWRLSRYSTQSTKIDDSFDAWCQFNKSSDYFKVELGCVDKMSPAEIIEWFNNVFEKLNCNYYERWEN